MPIVLISESLLLKTKARDGRILRDRMLINREWPCPSCDVDKKRSPSTEKARLKSQDLAKEDQAKNLLQVPML